jgi:ubiquinone/menaquinone biosynthesis C-methylase UbiE
MKQAVGGGSSALVLLLVARAATTTFFLAPATTTTTAFAFVVPTTRAKPTTTRVKTIDSPNKRACKSGGVLQYREARIFPVAELRSASSATEVEAPEKTAEETADDAEKRKEKLRLLSLLRILPTEDPVLCDPITKEGLVITSQSSGPWLGTDDDGFGRRRTAYRLRSPSHTYEGASDTFLNLLEPVDEGGSSEGAATTPRDLVDRVVRTAAPFVPPPLRSALATAGLPVGADYVPMRDLFTSPSVSFAYERGWRQNFAAAGFPGPDREAEMAAEYFEPPMRRAADGNGTTTTLVDMSCATGLFTRRFAKSGRYDRVLGCDYSESMLREARRRIERDPQLRTANRRRRWRHSSRTSPSSSPAAGKGGGSSTRLDLVRLDVGRIPMKDGSVDAVNAGAAMHCWPDLPAAAAEIYRVLKPGGRYFATTFLSSWFGALQSAEGGAAGPSRQAFQYFASVEQLRDLMASGGFARDKIQVEVLGRACVVIRCEK